MKKRKTYEISVIDKTYSKTIFDETKFYTSDTALELAFELKETEYNFESAEIVLLNVHDRSLVTRQVSKVNNDFVYEIDDDVTAHYGEWRGQLRFEKTGEIYVSSPIKFRIENDLSNERPPQLSDVQSWVSLKRYADSLIEELKQAVLSVERMEETFNANELERQTTFETAEQERQSAELTRIENENQRNLTSVDDFIKLQNAIGGRNLIPNFRNSKWSNSIVFDMSDDGYRISLKPNTASTIFIEIPVKKNTDYTFSIEGKNGRWFIYKNNQADNIVIGYVTEIVNGGSVYTFNSEDAEFVTIALNTWSQRIGTERVWSNLKLEIGETATPYTKAPEDYAAVSKDDYYNHIKLMSDHRDKQMAELKTAITALGGA